MLVKSQYQIVEKIIVSPEGVHFKAVFLVYQQGGKIKAKLISATPINSAELGNTVAMISAPRAEVISAYVKAIKYAPNKIIPSPFQSLINFTCSKPRGPNKA